MTNLPDQASEPTNPEGKETRVPPVPTAPAPVPPTAPGTVGGTGTSGTGAVVDGQCPVHVWTTAGARAPHPRVKRAADGAPKGRKGRRHGRASPCRRGRTACHGSPFLPQASFFHFQSGVHFPSRPTKTLASLYLLVR